MKDNLLLEKIRKLKHAFLQSDDRDSTTMEESGRKIAEATGFAVLIVGKEGNVMAGYPGEVDTKGRVQKFIEAESLAGSAELLQAVGAGEPVINKTFSAEKDLIYSVIPIRSNGKNLASLLLFHPGRSLEDNDIILAEVGAALTGIYILHKAIDKEEEDARNRKLAEVAFDSLSYSEVEAIREILKNIENNESIVVASKIADRLGITRSVIVNGLRKFESAGIIESRSLGMKGTFIRVINTRALEIVASRSETLGEIP